jgi:hypothetical protein
MSATDRAVDRLIEVSPVVTEHVLRYMIGVAWRLAYTSGRGF